MGRIWWLCVLCNEEASFSCTLFTTPNWSSHVAFSFPFFTSALIYSRDSAVVLVSKVHSDLASHRHTMLLKEILKILDKKKAFYPKRDRMQLLQRQRALISKPSDRCPNHWPATAQIFTRQTMCFWFNNHISRVFCDIIINITVKLITA